MTAPTCHRCGVRIGDGDRTRGRCGACRYPTTIPAVTLEGARQQRIAYLLGGAR